MGLRSGGDSIVVAGPCSGGGGGGHTTDSVSSESRSASLALVRGARGLVGRPRGPVRISVVCLYTGLLGGDSGTGITLTGSSSSSSSATVTSTTSSTTVTPSSPSLGLGDDNTIRLRATG
jgi:hypothetical protein